MRCFTIICILSFQLFRSVCDSAQGSFRNDLGQLSLPAFLSFSPLLSCPFAGQAMQILERPSPAEMLGRMSQEDTTTLWLTRAVETLARVGDLFKMIRVTADLKTSSMALACGATTWGVTLVAVIIRMGTD